MPVPVATKLNVLICFPSYGGNGGIDSEHPHIREWAIETILKMKNDPRIGEVWMRTIGDTPITMVRNRFFTIAQELGAHLIMSVDSDQSPNKHAGEPGFKPFWETAFNFIYENYGKGPRMVMAPYVGPAENIYLFRWRGKRNDGIHGEFSLEQYTREEAEILTGIQEVAAGPTGLYLMDMRLLELIEPCRLPKREILERIHSGSMSIEDGLWALREGYCYYEWKDQRADQKASTEDVTLTRDISLAGLETLGYNPLFCAWDSWIGHWKPRNFGKPQHFSVENVGASLRRAVLQNRMANEVQMDLGSTIDSGIPKEFLNPPPDWKPHNGNGHKTNGAVARSNGHAEQAKFHWGPLEAALRKVKDAIGDAKFIVDIGPGDVPLPVATEYVGKKSPKANYHGRPFHELDLSKDKLPYADGSVDFIYCRHVVEDLVNPENLLSEIRRVAKAGYIETPSPLSEASPNVNAPDSAVKGRGYPHHHSIVWSAFDGLMVLPKMPAWDQIELPEYQEELAVPELWNSYHFWEGPLQYTVLKNDHDYLLGVDDRYHQLAIAAIEHSRVRTGELFKLFAPPTDEMKDGHRVTTGAWCDHGHAPLSQRNVLADLVRSESYAKDRGLQILEVGSWLGKTAIAMADASHHSKVHCVDTWQGSPSDVTGDLAVAAGGGNAVYAKFLENIGERLDKTIFPWRGTSVEQSRKAWPKKFDIIFIDAEHTYEALKDDILGWWPHLADDGVMIGHDFGVQGYEGVGKAVREIFGEKFRAVGWTPQGAMWMVRKCDLPDGHLL